MISFGEYKVMWCHVCNQGWIEIVKVRDTNKLFMCCLECETEWDSPKDVLEHKSGTHNKYGQVSVPTYEEISNQGWQNFITKE